MSNFFSSNIKSSVVRRGRLTKSQKKAILDLSALFCVPFSQFVIQPKNIFGNDHPTVLDIGFGMGDEILDYARKNPQKNILGIEIYKPAIGNILKKIYELNIMNIRIVANDENLFLEYMIPNAVLSEIHIYFPDPWPKKKHKKRRLINEAFARILALKLESDGKVLCATDNQEYAEQILEIFDGQNSLKNMNTDYGDRPDERKFTKFEKKAFSNDSQVYEIYFAKLG